MGQCHGFKRGTAKPCGAAAAPGKAHCYNHDPENAEKRRIDGARRIVDDLLSLEGQHRQLAAVVYDLLSDKTCDPRRLTACVRGIEVLTKQTLLLEEREKVRNGLPTAGQTEGSRPKARTILDLLGPEAEGAPATDQAH